MTDNRTTELREAARSIQGNLGRRLYRRKDIDEMKKVSDLLFEAADTIESIGNGTLTAEQVRDVIRANTYPEQSTILEFSDSSWQAIADELNATLGEPKRAVCSECGMLLSDYILCTPCAEKFAVKR